LKVKTNLGPKNIKIIKIYIKGVKKQKSKTYNALLTEKFGVRIQVLSNLFLVLLRYVRRFPGKKLH